MPTTDHDPDMTRAYRAYCGETHAEAAAHFEQREGHLPACVFENCGRVWCGPVVKR